MSTSSDKFSEQFIGVQQQFKEWTPFEQLRTMVELTQTLQISYQYFLVQVYQVNIQKENNIMFNHTVDDANSPDIVTCLLSNSLDKILSTLQLYLPLISTKTMNIKLLDAYRDVLRYLDTNLNPSKLTYSEQQLIHLAQQIFFFIQINPSLQPLLSHIPKLIHLIQTKQFHSDEQQQQQQQQHQTLQRHASIRSQIPPLMPFLSEGSPNSAISQQLTRQEINDSGVDLTEPPISNPSQSFLSSHSSQYRWKTASSPIPEHATIDTEVRPLLKGVFSAPSPSTIHPDYRHKNSPYYQPKHISTLTKSDEEEQESPTSENPTSTENVQPLGQFYSLRYKNNRNQKKTDDVSQYLGVDANATSGRNTFSQPETGMKDVPKWLKHLRLHKYEFFFAQMTYDEMMNLTLEKLKAFQIVDGACAKILLNIKKLKERSTLLEQFLIELNHGQVDLANYIQQLNELMITPIRSKQLEMLNQGEEDLPKLIIEVLEKIYQQLTSHCSAEICYNLLTLIDYCYRTDAFTTDQVHRLLKWRRRLSTMLPSLSKSDYTLNQETFSSSVSQRRSSKPSVRPMKSAIVIGHSHYSPNPVALTKYSSAPQGNHLFESNCIRRPTKSPTLIYPTTEESNDINLQTSFSSTTSSPQRNNGAYLANNRHQALTRKASIDPSGENHPSQRNKLCKTFSDPNKIRFHHPNQSGYIQSSIRSQQNLIRMISTPYSHQTRPFLSRSPPTSGVSPISKSSYSDNDTSDYYDKISHTNEIDISDDQHPNHSELELFCRQITEKAISEDVNDSLMDCKDDLSDSNQPSNNSPDIEQ